MHTPPRVVFLLTLSILGSCKRPAPPPAIPITTPDATSETPPHPAPLPRLSILTLDGIETEFPRPILRTQFDQGVTSVQLYTRDAPSTDPDAPPRSAFNFDLKLETESPDLNGVQWHFRAADRERPDSPTGIFLSGGELVLEPFDATIVFTQTGSNVAAELDGDFLAFSAQETIPARKTVHVTGRLEASR